MACRRSARPRQWVPSPPPTARVGGGRREPGDKETLGIGCGGVWIEIGTSREQMHVGHASWIHRGAGLLRLPCLPAGPPFGGDRRPQYGDDRLGVFFCCCLGRRRRSSFRSTWWRWCACFRASGVSLIRHAPRRRWPVGAAVDVRLRLPITYTFLLCQAAAGSDSLAAAWTVPWSVLRWLKTMRARRRLRQRNASGVDMPSAFFLA